VLLIVGTLNALWGLAGVLNDDVLTAGGRGVILWSFTAWGRQPRKRGRRYRGTTCSTPLRRRRDPASGAQRALLDDRDLAEIAVHIQPNRPADCPHLILLASIEPENQRANDNDRYVLAAHPGKSQGRPPSKPELEAHRPQTACPTAFSEKAPVPVGRP
jgi:hypothetical protein